MSGAVPTLQPLRLLEFPFTGAQVIEASAGTGKTWTLASLYLRLVLGDGPDPDGLLPPRILVMTFTEAATQELRDRIRKRLAAAAAFFREQADPATPADRFLVKLRDRYPVADWPARAQRLEIAGQWMDEAAIHTIHGWSSRMLRQHAFDSGSLFQQERVEDSEALKATAVRDYWRHWIYPLDAALLGALEKFPASPDALLRRIKPELFALDRAPAEATDEKPPLADPAQIFSAWAAWYRRYSAAVKQARARWAANVDAIEAELREAMAKDLKPTNYPARYRDGYLPKMRSWCAGQQLKPNEFERFSRGKLQSSTKPGAATPVDRFGAYEALQQVCDCLREEPPLDPIYAHAAAEVHRRCTERKRELAQFDFSDLLQRLFDALQAEDGRLAAAIRLQYPVALVDEFQDTDRWQYGALKRIYLDAHASPAALVMIGDPKQAIYSFRGADLATYLHARSTAATVHTLTGNYRSTPALVNAVNHVFRTAREPFETIPYERVTAEKADVLPLTGADGRSLPAMTVWQAPADAPKSADGLRELLAQAFATQIVALLANNGARPAEIAVLVRDGNQARLIRKALQDRDVRSVYLSDRDSVYATDEARDLWYILRAVAQPRSSGAIRAALTTRSFGFEVQELDRLFADEAAFDAQNEQFARWQLLWQRQGFLALLYAVLHEQQIPARLLRQRDGERRLTNLLHLGDLLQKASLALQGEVAVVRYLAEQLREPAASGDSAQMRLETDADLVKVVTMHKSKGLQYPVVFVPFAYEFRPARKDDPLPDDKARLNEDIRVLYVAFTRAERALFVGAATRNQDFSSKGGEPKSALSRLLGRREPDDLSARLGEWARCPDIAVLPLPEANARPHVVPLAQAERRTAAIPVRQFASRWRSVSFSSLTRGLAPEQRLGLLLPVTDSDERYGDAQVDNPVPAVEMPAEPDTSALYENFPAGAKYGDLLHGLLEWQLKEGWPIRDAGAARPSWTALLNRRCDALRLDSDQKMQLTQWLAAIAACRLGLAADAGDDASLATLMPAQTWAEMGFTITTQGVAATAIDALVRQHVLPGQARDALNPAALEGLLTGFLDLVFEHQGRYYVLDYKSNRLGDYRPARLAAAILEHRYDLQYTLYLLALHRLLKARLPGYDYDRHIGGAIYLFARGIGLPGNGLYRDRPPRGLIESLDAAFREVPA